MPRDRLDTYIVGAIGEPGAIERRSGGRLRIGNPIECGKEGEVLQLP
jgi:hypothetical protein